MSDRIKLLPDGIANQIAAGEVVQRPASVVKELLENSIDAGATSVKLVLKDAGKSLIQVVDDGTGMSGTDARMSFERHATSKIRTSDDLFKINTLGFRGEALASIAAVAEVDMRTRRDEDELGTQLVVAASEVQMQEPVATGKGTSISVKNLFYNVPARRNFLKSNPVEMRHINDEFIRVALANPDIAMSLTQNDMEVYHLDAGKLSKRIVQIYGKNYRGQLIQCEEEVPAARVYGYAGKPDQSRKTRGEQFFFVNDRFIKSSYLNHAVLRAYEGLLRDDYFPFYVLFITIDPVHVDINVHPTKTEVKFDDERMLYGLVNSAVRQSLASYNVAPSLDFSSDVSFDHLSKQREEHLDSREKAYSSFQNVSKPDPDRLDRLNELYASATLEEASSQKKAVEEQPVVRTFQSAMEDDSLQEHAHSTYHLHNRYLIRQVKSGMIVLDKHAALERIFFEQYQRQVKAEKGLSQACLFPQKVELSKGDLVLVTELKDEIHALGFDFETSGESEVIIKGVPSELAPCNEQEVFEGLVEQYKHNMEQLNLPRNESLTGALARRTATSRCQKMKQEEMGHVMDQLFACEQPNYALDGSPTFIQVSLNEIDQWFGK